MKKVMAGIDRPSNNLVIGIVDSRSANGIDMATVSR